MDSDWKFVAAIGLSVIGLMAVGTVGLYIEKQQKSAVELEAIRAGLVQDKDGHWVKPELKEPSP